MIITDENLKKIAKAISRAVSTNIVEIREEYQIDKANKIPYLKGYLINAELKKVLGGELILREFRRGMWYGLLIIDIEHNITINICSENVLRRIMRDFVKSPTNYLRTINLIENNGLEPCVRQQCLYEDESDLLFDNEVSVAYGEIMGSLQTIGKTCHHYTIAYRCEHNRVIDLKLLMLNENMEIVHKQSLVQYINVDDAFIDWTQDEENIASEGSSVDKYSGKNTRHIVKLKRQPQKESGK